MVRQRFVAPTDSTGMLLFSQRPPDPSWAPDALLEQCRAALREFDGALGLWWDPIRRRLARDEQTGAIVEAEKPGRWTVVKWSHRSGAWEKLFWWEGADGAYREPNAGLLVARVGAIDLEAQGVNLKEVARNVHNENERRRETEKRDANGLAWEQSTDIASRAKLSSEPAVKISVSVKPGS